MSGVEENHLPSSWFRITGASALETELGNRFKPFFTPAYDTPSFVLLLNEEPFVYFDTVKDSSPTRGAVWVPEWKNPTSLKSEVITIHSKEGGMKHEVAKQYFALIDQHRATDQQAAGLAFACHKMCEKLMHRNWAQSENIGLFREAGDTSMLFLQLANSLLHHDRTFVDQVRTEQAGNVIRVHKPVAGAWSARERSDLPDGHEAEVVAFKPGGGAKR